MTEVIIMGAANNSDVSYLIWWRRRKISYFWVQASSYMKIFFKELQFQLIWLSSSLVMRPSRAGLSHRLRWRIFSSAWLRLYSMCKNSQHKLLYIDRFMEITIKLNVTMIQAQNWKILYLLTKYFQLGFSSKIEMPQLGSTWFRTLSAQFESARKIPARTHHYSI